MESLAPLHYQGIRMRTTDTRLPTLRPILPLLHNKWPNIDQSNIRSSPSPPGTPPKPSNFASMASTAPLGISAWSRAMESHNTNSKKLKRKRRSPPFSYSVMITQAILSSVNQRMTLRDIYTWISTRYPNLYASNETGWQNTIRHNLSLNRTFKKVPRRESGLPGKGGFWTVDFQYFDYETFRQKSGMVSSPEKEKTLSYTTRNLGQQQLFNEMQGYEASSGSDASYTVHSQSSSPNGSMSDYSLSPNNVSNDPLGPLASDSEYSAGPRRESMNIRNLLN